MFCNSAEKFSSSELLIIWLVVLTSRDLFWPSSCAASGFLKVSTQQRLLVCSCRGTWSLRTWQGAHVMNDSWYGCVATVASTFEVDALWRNPEIMKLIESSGSLQWPSAKSQKPECSLIIMSENYEHEFPINSELTCWELSHLNIRFVMADILCAHWMSCLAITRRGTANHLVLVRHCKTRILEKCWKLVGSVSWCCMQYWAASRFDNAKWDAPFH